MKYIITLITLATSLIAREYKAYPNPCRKNFCSKIFIEPISGKEKFKNNQVRLKVYDYNMKLIYERDHKLKFSEPIVWSKVNQMGKRVSSGLYFLFIIVEGEDKVKREWLKVIIK